jgi:hypothetical protein
MQFLSFFIQSVFCLAPNFVAPGDRQVCLVIEPAVIQTQKTSIDTQSEQSTSQSTLGPDTPVYSQAC